MIVSAAAYTAVDKAESDPDLAFAINERRRERVAERRAGSAVPLIHLSTDYVFDGTKPSPYVENDPTGPTGVYGASKLAGEQAVLAEAVQYRDPANGMGLQPVRQRISSRRCCASQPSAMKSRVVADQRGNPDKRPRHRRRCAAASPPTCASDDASKRGIFHMTGAGEASWAEFAEAIFAPSAEAGGPSAAVKPSRTADYPTPAKRPANSRLDCSQARARSRRPLARLAIIAERRGRATWCSQAA